MEDDLWGKTTYGGRQPLLKDDLGWKTTFSERRPVVEDDLQWKTTFSGRRPLLDSCMMPTLLCGIFEVRRDNLMRIEKEIHENNFFGNHHTLLQAKT